MTRHKAAYDRLGKGRRRWAKDGGNTMANEMDSMKLKRKLRIMTNDRNVYAREIYHSLKKQRSEIDMLMKENDGIRRSLHVAYGPRQVSGDIANAKTLREMLDARDDYEKLAAIEATACKELDLKIQSLQGQQASLRRKAGGEDVEYIEHISRQRCIFRLENRVNKLTTDFCMLLHGNEQVRDNIKLLVKQKKMYENLYQRVSNRISNYRKQIMMITKDASNHYEQRLEAMAKIVTLKDRSIKDESMFQAEMKILQRMVAHDNKMKWFMDTKENERLTYKAEEAEKRTKMSLKEKALNDESLHVTKYEDLFHSVKAVTGHKDIEKIVNEFTAKDEDNFARFDYVSELNYDVEQLHEYIQNVKSNIQKVRAEDQKEESGSEIAVNDLKLANNQLSIMVAEEGLKLSRLNDMLDTICGAVHLLFKRINCSASAFQLSLRFENHVSVENINVYLTLIEQRCLQLICILKFIGLHQDHHENLLKAPRSLHRIRPQGPSRILLETIDANPAMPSINTPVVSEELMDMLLESEDASLPMDVEQLRNIAMKKIAKKEAAGLLNQRLFVQDKRTKPKGRKNDMDVKNQL